MTPITQTQGKVLDLVKYDDPILYKETVPFDFSKQNAAEVAEDLKATLLAHRGYGLSANQVGLPYSVFVFGNGRDEKTITAFFNPKISDLSGDQDAADEGCLSFPGLIAKIFRSKELRLRFTDVNNEIRTIRLTGVAARIVQHEMCHLHGKPFFAGFSKLKVDMMVAKCAKRTGIQYDTRELMNLRK